MLKNERVVTVSKEEISVESLRSGACGIFMRFSFSSSQSSPAKKGSPCIADG